MYKKNLWKPIMAGTLALTMLLTPLGTGGAVIAAEMETAGTETMLETLETEETEEETAEAESTETTDQTPGAEALEAEGRATAEVGDIDLDEAHFPDANFRSWLSENVDADKDGKLSKTERDACTSIDVKKKTIGSLVGIEYFTELTELNCVNNELTSLDISANAKLQTLSCTNNQLTSLDVSANTNLTELLCYSNSLTSLDVSANTNLEKLYCASNSLTSLDVSANTKLTVLNFYNNLLTSFDVRANTELITLSCAKNSLTSVDVSANTKLTQLWCYENNLTSLNLSANTKLTELRCYENNLTSLDLSANTDLEKLYCYDNSLTSLDVSGSTKLTTLECYNNPLTSLDVSGSTKLTSLKLSGCTELTTLNVSGCTELAQLSCGGNQLANLDVSGCTKLAKLWCNSSQLVNLDVSGSTKLTTLECSYNPLTSLDVNGCTELTSLHCYNNELTSLDVSGCTKLTELWCYNNQLTGLDVSGCTKLTTLWGENNQLTSLDVGVNTKLKYFYCNGNRLTSLDVSGCTELTVLECDNNQLTGLDVSMNTKLKALYCNNNRLVNLNVSGATELAKLICNDNELTSLDVGANTKLTTLECNNNVYYAKLDAGRKYALSQLPGSFDYTKASNVSGGTFSATELIFDEGSDTVTYTYACQNSFSRTFTIKEFKAVQAIALDKTTASVFKGETLQLNATVAPEEASIQKLEWTTSDSSIATVSADGLVTGKALGTATITCTAKDGSGVKATCEVTVTNPVTKIILDKTAASLLKDETLQLNATVEPENATDKSVEWTTSDSSIATVSEDGLVTAVGGGTATITCTARDGSGVKATCVVTVKSLVTKLTLNKTKASVFKGKSVQLKATITPSDATDKSVTWKSSNTKVATVSTSGKVTAKAVGTATITCTAKDGSGVKATCKITVTNPVTKIKLNQTSASLSPKETLQLKATVTPSNATNKAVTWKSSNTKVATVSSSGKVAAKKAGTVTITCTAKDGSGKKATCKITVYTNTEAFVARIYTKALNRTAEEAGLKYWTEEINSGRKTPVEVAESFFFAPEFTNKNLSNTEYVKVLYRTFMGREYDTAGLNYWVGRLNKGESRKSVLESFTGCQEFKDIVKSFGL